MTRRTSRWLALGGLAGLAVMLAVPPTPVRLLCSFPLIAAILTGLPGPARWGLPVAILMLPYFSYGVMAILTEQDARLQAVAFSVMTVGIFLAAMDSMRRA